MLHRTRRITASSRWPPHFVVECLLWNNQQSLSAAPHRLTLLHFVALSFKVVLVWWADLEALFTFAVHVCLPHTSSARSLSGVCSSEMSSHRRSSSVKRPLAARLTCLCEFTGVVLTCLSSLLFISNVCWRPRGHHILIQTSDMWSVLLPSHSSSASSHVSINQHPKLLCLRCSLQYLWEKDPSYQLPTLALAHVGYKTQHRIGNAEHRSADMSVEVIGEGFSLWFDLHHVVLA